MNERQSSNSCVHSLDLGVRTTVRFFRSRHPRNSAPALNVKSCSLLLSQICPNAIIALPASYQLSLVPERSSLGPLLRNGTPRPSSQWIRAEGHQAHRAFDDAEDSAIPDPRQKGWALYRRSPTVGPSHATDTGADQVSAVRCSSYYRRARWTCFRTLDPSAPWL